jgi:hypothetical protein
LIGKDIIVNPSHPEAELVERLIGAARLHGVDILSSSLNLNARSSVDGDHSQSYSSSSSTTTSVGAFDTAADIIDRVVVGWSDAPQSTSSTGVAVVGAEHTSHVTVSTTESNEFCHAWANRLRLTAQTQVHPSSSAAASLSSSSDYTPTGNSSGGAAVGMWSMGSAANGSTNSNNNSERSGSGGGTSSPYGSASSFPQGIASGPLPTTNTTSTATNIATPPPSPIVLRQLLEQTKAQVNQDLNFLRRLVDQATIDNYALYEAFLQLKTNGNSDVLLVLLLRDVATTDNQAKEVLEVIYNYLREPPLIVETPSS